MHKTFHVEIDAHRTYRLERNSKQLQILTVKLPVKKYLTVS